MKPIVAVIVLLPTLELAQPLPQPKPTGPGGSCPHGYTSSGSFCVPSQGAPRTRSRCRRTAAARMAGPRAARSACTADNDPDIHPQALKCMKAADRRNLRDDALDASVMRRHLQDVSPRVTRTKDPDLGSVDLRPQACKRDRIAVTTSLQLRVYLLPWLAAGFAEIDIVVGDDGKASTRKVLRIFED